MFWVSYECFSILCNVFLLKSAISSHNSCSDCTTSLMTHLTISYWKGFGQERILTIYTPPPLLKGASTQTSFLPVVAFPFLVHLAWVFKHTLNYNSYLQFYLDLDNTSDLLQYKKSFSFLH